MVYSVKISELPVRNSVVGTDLVPVVDAAETQTSTVTAAQIAAIGGGPPGDLTVTTAKIVDKAVTYQKIQDTTTNNIVLGRSSTGGGTVEEILCTPYARTILAAPDSTTALAAIGGLQSANNPTFTGTVTVNGNLTATGTITATTGFAGIIRASESLESAPAISFSSDTDTGIRRGGPNALGLVTGGLTRVTVADASVSFFVPLVNIPPGTSSLLTMFACRAWANYYGRSPAVMRGNGGFTSISRIATGRYSFQFNFVMPDANYAVVCNGRTNNNFVLAGWDFGVNGFEVRQYDNNTDTLWDLDWGSVIVIR